MSACFLWSTGQWICAALGGEDLAKLKKPVLSSWGLQDKLSCVVQRLAKLRTGFDGRTESLWSGGVLSDCEHFRVYMRHKLLTLTRSYMSSFSWAGDGCNVQDFYYRAGWLFQKSNLHKITARWDQRMIIANYEQFLQKSAESKLMKQIATYAADCKRLQRTCVCICMYM